ncbi:Pkinase-domain-containing protein [Exidia glandulosa HHB12029]|uniref:Pkinase-domain-containing protein n=1 Tax=Exidia glandulosa HHB12029 TaxID=1314781 RepID=A0A165PHY2_EXIGL|nr:Pkinase-domain-containing protein [Exidia glandulosa HHB12029]
MYQNPVQVAHPVQHHNHHYVQSPAHSNGQRQHQPVTELVLGIPSMTIQGDRVVVGDANSSSTRSWTQLKIVGDGSFGTVWLCDWHSPLPPGTPLSPMQCGAGARPEWNGKVLVALKRMKKRWEGGWDDCKKLKELESLRVIPPHENVIPLYDYFLLPSTKELYFVFESMEGNLYQLIKSRKGRPLATGLVFSIFRQVVHGLHHIHHSGYFHRDMKPENLLVTTTGLAEYVPAGGPTTTPDKDVMVIIKIADFGLARETQSRPPYTEYVATRWYRAPEVLLRSRDYSNPVDMWALGTILAELINLKPLFPGQGEIDQVLRITEILGEPTDKYGTDERGRVVGGGPWPRGVAMAESVGFMFRKSPPIVFSTLFQPAVPRALVDCIEDLLRYDPAKRLTTYDLLQHPYMLEMQRLPPMIPITPQPPPPPAAAKARAQASTSLPSLSPRAVPPSHSHSPAQPKEPFPHPDPSSTHRQPHSQPHPQLAHHHQDAEMAESHVEYNNMRRRPPPSPTPSSVYSFGADRVNGNGSIGRTGGHDWNSMAVDGEDESTVVEGYAAPTAQPQQPQPHKSGLIGSLSFKKKPKGWGIFGGGDKNAQHALSPVEEQGHMAGAAASGSTPSLKRPKSASGSTSDGPSMPELPTVPPAEQKRIAKERKREMEKMAREEEKQRRALAEAWNREQARAVMLKRNQMIRQNTEGTDFDWHGSVVSHLDATPASKKPQLVVPTVKEPPPPPAHQQVPVEMHHPMPHTLHPSKSFLSNVGTLGTSRTDYVPSAAVHRYSDDSVQHRTKARRRDADDDHSNSDVQSISHMSMISFATVDSDPGPARRHQAHHSHHTGPPPSAYTINRASSMASFRTTTDHSQHSSFEGGLSSDYGRHHLSSRASSLAGSPSPVLHPAGSPPPLSPPPMHALSLSTGHWHAGSEGSSPSPNSPAMRNAAFVGLPGIATMQPRPFDPGPSSAINPMFQVPEPQGQGLPPFSQLVSVAERQHQPASPLQRPHPQPPD